MVIDTHRKKHPLMLGVMMFINASRHEGYHWFLQLVSKPLALIN